MDINRRDYRAWYGLGQTYELLKMYSYALYYYKQVSDAFIYLCSRDNGVSCRLHVAFIV